MSSTGSSTFLRANGISLYFPVSPGHDVGGDDAMGTSSVGGNRATWRGRPAIKALDTVTLELGDGDRVGVIGHNGSGKSTLLRTLAGIYYPQEGRVSASGPVSGIFNVAIGFRQEATGMRNIVLKGLMAGRTHAEIAEAIDEIAEFTELGDYLHAPLKSYSQGMALRLAFATTTAFNHDILVMDEWIGAGDARFQEKVVRRMNSMLDRTRIHVVASHNNSLLRRVTDRCLWLDAGAVRQFDDTAVVLDAYEHELAGSRQEPEETTVVREEIPPGHRVLWFEGDAPSPTVPVSLALRWNVERFGVPRTTLSVLPSSQAEETQERVVFIARGAERRSTGPWVRPGMVFRLRDQRDNAILADLVVPARDAG